VDQDISSLLKHVGNVPKPGSIRSAGYGKTQKKIFKTGAGTATVSFR
jgi:hypothetical protein